MIRRRLAVLGAGNIGLSLAKGLVKAQKFSPGDITLTRRSKHALASWSEQGYKVTTSNRDAVLESDYIVLTVLPQQLNTVLDEVAEVCDERRHAFISVVAGVASKDVQNRLCTSNSSKHKLEVIRAMPNTAIAIGESMTCIGSDNASSATMEEVKGMFNTVGTCMEIHEELMTSATALNACGVAFFLRAIRAASQGGVEIGFHAEDALKMATQTCRGAAALLQHYNSHPENEIDKVTSPKGCTIAGLNEMEHEGFSSSLIRGIRLSHQKAGGLYGDNNGKPK